MCALNTFCRLEIQLKRTVHKRRQYHDALPI